MALKRSSPRQALGAGSLAALLLGWAQAAPLPGTCWSRPAVLPAAQPCGLIAFPHTACPASARLFFSSSFTRVLLPASARSRCSFARIDPMVLRQMSRSIPSHLSAPNSVAQTLWISALRAGGAENRHLGRFGTAQECVPLSAHPTMTLQATCLSTLRVCRGSEPSRCSSQGELGEAAAQSRCASTSPRPH